MRRINGKLTVADRSGALFLLAHNPKVAGSNPAPATKFQRLTAWHLATPVSFVSDLCLSRLERPLSRGLIHLFGAAPSVARLLRAQAQEQLWPVLTTHGIAVRYV